MICPMGFRLAKTKQKGSNTIYANKKPATSVSTSAQPQADTETVSFSADTQIVPVRLYGHSQTPPQSIPDGMAVNPYNHTAQTGVTNPNAKSSFAFSDDTALTKTRMYSPNILLEPLSGTMTRDTCFAGAIRRQPLSWA